MLGAWVVVELQAKATPPSQHPRLAITRRADRAHRRHLDRQQRGERHQTGRVEHTSQRQPEREMGADAR